MTVTDDELRRSVNQAVQEIGKRFYGSEWPMRNDANIYQALNILQVDIASALERADDMQAVRDEINEIIDHTDTPEAIRKYVSLDTAWRDAEIRRDWASALRSVRHGEALSHEIGWAFSTRDIKNLAKLHKANRFQKKIEDLLEDCNFHTEAALMSSQQYDKLLNEEDVTNE